MENQIKNRKGLSAVEYSSNADITDLTDEELQELNDEKDMMIWLKKYNAISIFFISVDFWLNIWGNHAIKIVLIIIAKS